MLARSRDFKAPRRCFAPIANNKKSFSSKLPTFANAHAMLAKFCALNSSNRRSADLAKALSRILSHGSVPLLTAPQATLASYLPPIFATSAALRVCFIKSSNVPTCLAS
eukprot:gnl/TRDRNA2_/TRDRNA2_68578_c0_seq1.p1 gnl/TRDRNA2_/TRDRNA2_68578_c0~~gnl/TRDRNA2_/TRDRNA2_68578_c0_seq1.p1  ORF type:complete len:109 (-),score=3.47 gnl/TRDRNA2_/TRDRNA2_68578_c0_seq1:209-535(-)